MYNSSYQDILVLPFTETYHRLSPTNLSVHLEDHEILKKYLCADLSSQDAEIPTALLGAFRDTLLMPEREWEQIAMPLFYGRVGAKRTSDSIIKEFFRGPSIGSSRLSKVTTGKTTYYGGHGMVFDKNMEPLILYTVNLSDIASEGTTWSAKATAFNLRVAPCVFTDKSDTLKKYIVSKMIPALVSANLGSTFLRGLAFDRELPPVVIVEDLSRWFGEPEEVRNVNTFGRDMKEFLSREDIIQDILRCL